MVTFRNSDNSEITYWGGWSNTGGTPMYTISLKKLEIKRVVFNGFHTIVFWSDNSQTKVSFDGEGDIDYEKALALAVSKKFLGSTTAFLKAFNNAEYFPKPSHRAKLLTNQYIDDETSNLIELDALSKMVGKKITVVEEMNPGWYSWRGTLIPEKCLYFYAKK